ncbi:MAG TPA: zf-HC2 domain-containing protein [Pyrinomonadaceae bacterium]|nr:zf-HC2 domain-containing protein [Pyrinomonadaceae bacterium]
MDCPLMEKVSQLIDGELSSSEAATTRAHITVCEACQRAHSDFQRLQREIKASDVQLETFTTDRAMRKVLGALEVPFWRRRIAVPIPVLAMLSISIVAMGFWGGFLRSQTAGTQTAKVRPAPAEAKPQDTLDLSHFDHGKRATVIKVSRTETFRHQ